MPPRGAISGDDVSPHGLDLLHELGDDNLRLSRRLELDLRRVCMSSSSLAQHGRLASFLLQPFLFLLLNLMLDNVGVDFGNSSC